MDIRKVIAAASVITILVAIATFAVGTRVNTGKPLDHNDVPVDRIMEIQGVGHSLGRPDLPDATPVLLAPWSSNDEPKYYQLGVGVPDGAKCLMAKASKGGFPHNPTSNVISFVTCPTPHYGP